MAQDVALEPDDLAGLGPAGEPVYLEEAIEPVDQRRELDAAASKAMHKVERRRLPLVVKGELNSRVTQGVALDWDNLAPESAP
jgi:hypothetical protein